MKGEGEDKIIDRERKKGRERVKVREGERESDRHT